MISFRKAVPTLLLVFLCCSGFRACVDIGNPVSDQNMAVNRWWIVTGTNNGWVFSPVPGSGNTNAEYRTGSYYFSTPGHPCAGLSLFGEPMVVADPADGRFWFHVNDGHQGCLFASAGPDPRGPFIRGFFTPVADGLWVTVTSDKVVLMGYTAPNSLNLLVFNKADLEFQAASPRMQTIPLAHWSHPIYNRTTGAYRNDAWVMGKAPNMPDRRRVIEFVKVTGVPGIGAGAATTVYDVALPTNDLPFFEDSLGATQPDGTMVHFPTSTPGMWSMNGSIEGPAWIVQTGAPNGIPRLGLYGFDLIHYTAPTLILGGNIAPPYTVGGVPDGAFGCPTLAVLDNVGQKVIVGVNAASPSHYLGAFARNASSSSTWASMAAGTGPVGGGIGFQQDYRMDFCVGAAADGVTACQTQTYYSAGSSTPTARTRCFDGW